MHRPHLNARTTTGKEKGKKQDKHKAFLDLMKAYDSVSTSEQCESIHKLGITEKLIETTKTCTKKSVFV